MRTLKDSWETPEILIVDSKLEETLTLDNILNKAILMHSSKEINFCKTKLIFQRSYQSDLPHPNSSAEDS